MVIVTAIFTANMLGLFEIQLPPSMQTWLATKGGHSYLRPLSTGYVCNIISNAL